MSDVDSKEFVLAGIVMKRLLSEEQTAGQFCLFENKAPETRGRRSMSTPMMTRRFTSSKVN